EGLGPLPIRELWLSGHGEEVDTGRIGEMDLMERVEGLRLVFLGGADVRDLLSSSRLRLRRLDVAGSHQSHLDVGRLLDLPALRGIERLVLGPDELTDDTAARMAATTWPNLRELDVGTIG